MQSIANIIVVGLVLTLGAATRASAAERAAPSESDAAQRGAHVQAPEAELKALDDTLQWYLQRLARPVDGLPAITAQDAGRTYPSAAEAELDAMTGETLARSAAPRAASHALAGSQTVPSPASHDADADDLASEAHDDAPSARLEKAGSVVPYALASDAHDDSGLSAAAFDPTLGGPAKREGENPSSASPRDAHAAASDDCTCS